MVESVDRYKTKHALSLLASVGQLKEDKSLCDFIIKVGSKNFDVHRTIVSACSKYFRAMLTHDMKESRESIVDMKNVTANSVEKCIQFMYYGEVDLQIEDVENVLYTASIMQLDLLVTLCFDYAKQNTTVANVFMIKDLAKAFHNESISESCNAYISAHFEEVSEKEEFLALEYAELQGYITNLVVDKGLMWQAIVKWMGSQKERKKLLSGLLESYYAIHTDMCFLLTVVTRTRSVRKSPDCIEYILSILLSDLERAKENVTIETCYNMDYILKKCVKPEADILREKIKCFMVDNFEQISQMLEWVNLDKDAVTAILQDDELLCSSETTKWDAALKWTKHERRRKENFHELLNLLEFDAFTDEFIEMIRKEPLVAESAACMGIVLDAVMKAAKRLQTKPTARNTSDELYQSEDDGDEASNKNQKFNQLQISDDSDDDSQQVRFLDTIRNWQTRASHSLYRHPPPHHPPPFGHHRQPPPHHPPPYGHHRHPSPHHLPQFGPQHPPPHHHPRLERARYHHDRHGRFGPRGHGP